MPNIQTKVCREQPEKFGDKGGLFDLVVKPMLQQGHENELCTWMKDWSLIRSSASCASCNGRNMTWSPARIIDKYNWTCPDCNTKKSIRQDSFFYKLKCDLKLCLQIVLAWCQGAYIEKVAECLVTKEHIVKKVYEQCAFVANHHIKKFSTEWRLGGPGMVVIVDEYPGGYMTQNAPDMVVSKKRNNNAHTILCIAEINQNCVPPNMWFHVMSSCSDFKMDKNNSINTNAGFDEAILQITQHVLSGSLIVANNRARCCNFENVQKLNKYKVVSIENMVNYDTAFGSSILRTLDTIWRTAVDICEEAQDAAFSDCKHMLATHLWRQKYGTQQAAFQSMINHIVEFNSFS